MKRIEKILLTISVLGISIITLIFVTTSSSSSIEGNIERRAYQDLEQTADNHTSRISKSVEEHYSMLEILASYLGNKDSFSFQEERDVTDAFVLKKHLRMLAFADLDGNAISYEDEELGNIADCDYFKKAVSWEKGEKAIQFMPATDKVDKPSIILAVPVIHKNNMSGILLAAIEPNSLYNALDEDAFMGKGVSFIVDGQGNFISKNLNCKKHVTETNLFDDYFISNKDTNIRETIISQMAKNKSGSLTINHHGEQEFLSYVPVDIDDWYVFTFIDVSTARARYAQNSDVFKNTVSKLIICYVICLIVVLVTIGFTVFNMVKRNKELTEQEARYQQILDETKQIIFDYDSKTRKTMFMQSLSHLLGYQLPNNWIDDIQLRVKKHKEFDYNALLQKMKEVELSGQKDHIVLNIQTKEKGLRKIDIHMKPLYDDNAHLTHLIGQIDDITDDKETAESLQWEEHMDAEPEAIDSNITLENKSVDQQIETPIASPTEQECYPHKVYARTFGTFDLFIDEKPLHFTSDKVKELLAILVDRNGGTLSAPEAISILWEDEPAGERSATSRNR